MAPEAKPIPVLITIPLTDRPPVKINANDWPILADVRDREIEYEDADDPQDKRRATWSITVRQHEDGRAIVETTYSYFSAVPDERNYELAGGRMVLPGDRVTICDAIRYEYERLENRMPAGLPWSAMGHFKRLAQECMAVLPAEEI